MDRLNQDEQRALVGELLVAVKRVTPEWTNPTDHDPGVTLLELFAWLLDIVQFQDTTASDSKRAVLNQVLEKINALPRVCTGTGGLTRPRYFTGQLLTEADFQLEQDYVRGKIRRHNQCLFGSGIVTGLSVALESSSVANDQPVIVISPGCAIDCNGEQLTVCEPLRCSLHTSDTGGYVSVRYFEQVIGPVTSVGGSNESSRIEEGVAVDFEQIVPFGCVTIARLERIGGKWIVDSHFQPDTIRSGVSRK
jgi:hypothetical protein